MEYATREQAQQAVNTLSNQNLMGRLVYVREVNLLGPLLSRRLLFPNLLLQCVLTDNGWQDREAEPRFIGPPAGRGGFEGASRGEFGGGGYGGASNSTGGRQVFVNNVCHFRDGIYRHFI